MAKYQNGGDEVKKEWWPEAGEDIRCDSGQQNNDSKGKPVFNYQVVKFHTNCLIGPKDNVNFRWNRQWPTGNRQKIQVLRGISQELAGGVRLFNATIREATTCNKGEIFISTHQIRVQSPGLIPVLSKSAGVSDTPALSNFWYHPIFLCLLLIAYCQLSRTLVNQRRTDAVIF